MIIALVQSKSAVSYDPANPGDMDIERCRALAGAEMDRGFGLVEQACSEGADLVVTIEAFNSTLSHAEQRYPYTSVAEPLDGPVIGRFSSLAKTHSTHIVAGLYTTREGRCYNSAIMFGPDGDILEIFDKVHLPAGEERVITHGTRYPVVVTEHGAIGMLICWDLQYPEAAREITLGGADLIVCPTWGWEKRYGLCRAYENGVYIAAAMGVPLNGAIWDFCDPSCLVDNMGRVIAEGNRTHRGIVKGEVDIRKEPEPQYGSGQITGWDSMRRIRMSQRRPETYTRCNDARPAIFDKWEREE